MSQFPSVCQRFGIERPRYQPEGNQRGLIITTASSLFYLSKIVKFSLERRVEDERPL